MTEPTSQAFSFAALAIALLGPDHGPAVAILLSAMGGAVWGVSASPVRSRLAGVGLFIRYTLTAVVLVGGGTAIAQEQLAMKWNSPLDLSALVAFAIAAFGNQAMSLGRRLISRKGKPETTQ